jgi:hypothetical protein
MSAIAVAIPTEDYHQNLISCQVACPVSIEPYSQGNERHRRAQGDIPIFV